MYNIYPIHGVASSMDSMGINFCHLHGKTTFHMGAENQPKLPFLFFGPDILGYNLDR